MTTRFWVSVLLIVLATARLATPQAACHDVLAVSQRFIVALRHDIASVSADTVLASLAAYAPRGPIPIHVGAAFRALSVELGGPDMSPAVRSAVCDALPLLAPAVAAIQSAEDVWRATLTSLPSVGVLGVEAERVVSVAAPVASLYRRQSPGGDSGRCEQRPPGNWALDRIDQPDLPLDNVYRYACPSASSTNATVYVLDTGIYAEHSEFEGRVALGPTFADGTSDSQDQFGHGTFTAALVGGKTYGVHKRAQMVSVRVLGADGTGSLTSVLRGLQYVSSQAGPDKVTIANLSLGSLRSSTVNDAVDSAAGAGVTVVAAAGNESIDACLTSPASARGAITVAATTRTDSLADFSNAGACVDILAPGEDITSAWIGAPDARRDASGTSFAAPLVAGTIALYAATGDVRPGMSTDDVEAVLNRRAAEDKISVGRRFSSLFSPTPNRLVQV